MYVLPANDHGPKIEKPFPPFLFSVLNSNYMYCLSSMNCKRFREHGLFFPRCWCTGVIQHSTPMKPSFNSCVSSKKLSISLNCNPIGTRRSQNLVGSSITSRRFSTVTSKPVPGGLIITIIPDNFSEPANTVP